MNGTFRDPLSQLRKKQPNSDVESYRFSAYALEEVPEQRPCWVTWAEVVGGCLLVCIRGLRERGKDWVYPAVGIAATALVAIHSWFDFSLQIPAVAMSYACIMGVACAQSYSSLRA